MSDRDHPTPIGERDLQDIATGKVAQRGGKIKKGDLFAPIPVRTIGDQRLSAIHFRAISAVAAHDRMSVSRAGGQGCWASNKTLATMMGVNYTNLSTALTQLGEWGYISSTPHPLNKRNRVLRVIYGDLPVCKAPDQSSDCVDLQKGKMPTDFRSELDLPGGKPSRSVMNDGNAGEAGISGSSVCPPELNAQAHQRVDAVEYIPLKREDILQKQETNSEESAPMRNIGAMLKVRNQSNPGATLAIIERELRAGGVLDLPTELVVQRILDNTDYADPEHHQAGRILETWGQGGHGRGLPRAR